jgi:hypothetical protein
MRYSAPVFYMQSKTVWVLGRCAADALFFTVQLRLASLGLLHVEKIQERTKRNSCHQENHPEVKYFLDTRLSTEGRTQSLRKIYCGTVFLLLVMRVDARLAGWQQQLNQHKLFWPVLGLPNILSSFSHCQKVYRFSRPQAGCH